jgi:hypothetical protein
VEEHERENLVVGHGLDSAFKAPLKMLAHSANRQFKEKPRAYHLPGIAVG